MSDYGPGNTVKAQEPIDPGSDNVHQWPLWHRNEQGQFAPKADPVGFELKQGIVPVTQETDVVEQTPEQVQENVSAFMSTLQYMSNAVVRASEFARELKTLRAEFDELKHQVEVYRATNARLDEEVQRLREERARLQDENAGLRMDKSELESNLKATEEVNKALNTDRDRIQEDWIRQNDQLRTAQLNLSDEQRKVRELEAMVQQLTSQRDMWENEAHVSRDKLERIRQEVGHTSLAA